MQAFQDGTLEAWFKIIQMAALRSGVEAVQACSRLADRHGPAPHTKAALWREIQQDVTVPLAAELAERAAAEQRAPAAEVEIAEALATRRCAHLGCTDVSGPSEASAPRGKKCSGCQRVRYCSKSCQKADWKAHKIACRELAEARGGTGPSGA